jgi:type I restriction enzyme, S subunit
MSQKWPGVPLGSVLTQVWREHAVDPSKDYRLLGARWYAGGLFLKDVKSGQEIRADRLYRVLAGDFIYNRLFAWKGSFALATDEVDGCSVSNEFPCFEIDHARLDGRFLWSYFRQEHTWVEALGLSSGATPTSRNRLKEVLFLKMIMPLPPLPEQQRIVARIEDIADRIRGARDLRGLAAKELATILDAFERRLWPPESLASAKTLAEVTTFLARGRHSEQGESNHRLIKTQHVQQGRYVPTGLTLASHVAARVTSEAVARTGDILIACSAAGCLGRVARYQDRGHATSTDTHVAIARANQNMIEPEYLYVYLRGATGQHQLRSRERGDWEREKIGFRLTELNLKDLKTVPVPLPDKPAQRRLTQEVEAFHSQVEAVKRLQTETAAELDALLPAVLDRAFKGEV